MFPLWLLALTAQADDCDPTQALGDAEQLVLEARLDEARQALHEAEKAFSCGSVAKPEQLARAWLIEGAVDTFGGDRDAAADAFSAAARVAPDLWLPSLGDKLKARYDAVAGSVMGEGQLAQSGAPEGAFVAIDGSPATLPASLPGGLHLVQVGRSADDIRWAQVVFTPPQQEVALRVTPFPMEDASAPPPVQAAEPAVVEAPAEVSDPASVGVFGHLAVGAGSVFGDPLDLADAGGQVLSEPGIKLMAPIEGGLVFRPSGAWVRGAVGAAPMLGGQLVYGTDGGAAAWPLSVFGHVGGGLSVSDADVGLMAGLSLPGRIETRAVFSMGLGSAPLRAELRAGLNVPTERKLEPALGLLLAFDPSRSRSQD